jgi:hypothetical protein
LTRHRLNLSRKYPVKIQRSRSASTFPRHYLKNCQIFNFMKSLFPLIIASFVACGASAHAGEKLTLPTSKAAYPTPGTSKKKRTRVDFKHDNSACGNGEQAAPGNSAGSNNAVVSCRCRMIAGSHALMTDWSSRTPAQAETYRKNDM